jgi:hypothetical protein
MWNPNSRLKVLFISYSPKIQCLLPRTRPKQFWSHLAQALETIQLIILRVIYPITVQARTPNISQLLTLRKASPIEEFSRAFWSLSLCPINRASLPIFFITTIRKETLEAPPSCPKTPFPHPSARTRDRGLIPTTC